MLCANRMPWYSVDIRRVGVRDRGNRVYIRGSLLQAHSSSLVLPLTIGLMLVTADFKIRVKCGRGGQTWQCGIHQQHQLAHGESAAGLCWVFEEIFDLES